ncbi:LysR substrate-binding domain-containing protein [Magnetospirillum fulvum]|uniref:Transcriptional regulator, LysR family n=1 Tax=Magnetospirillum fulvum TaxID=1082 RepID=A0A1H6IS73_MAGFU|nr:LysR substrate-binding domain-containing protein [Magnetospirillum fulvum]SEH49497.1 transcriptional regulator, LysR family [Magnetospirillum fulvum]
MDVSLPRVAGDRRITLDQLRAFVAVAEEGGFHAAGAHLGRTQSAVTQSVKALEDSLDSRLLDRRRGHVVGLTAEGQRFLPHAREILARLSEAVGALTRPDLRGRIALGVPDDFPIADLHGAISRCLGLNPRLRIEVISALSAQITAMVRAGDLDIAIFNRIEGGGGDDEAEILRTEPLSWVGRERVRFDGTAPLPLCVFPEGCPYRVAGIEALQGVGATARFAYVSASYDNVRAAISAGLGLGLLPAGAIGADQVRLGAAEGFPPLPRIQLVMVVRGRGMLFSAFADYLRAAPGLVRV